MMNVRITVMRMAAYSDLMEEYENPIEHACGMRPGQVFVAHGWRKPEGMCDSAWETLSPFVMTLAHGGTDLYDGWMKNRRAAMLSCNDGFRPVSFLLEALPNYRYLFFDLDGTLTQSEYGVLDSVMYALEKFGIHTEDREELKKFIGPALFESFRNFYGFDVEDAERAVAFYREHYERDGIYRTPLYEGVEEMLRALSEMGKQLFVVTAKPQEMAEVVLHNLGIRQYFREVIGPGRGEQHTDKAALIRRALDLLAQDGDRVEKSLMIGDRNYDIEGANQTGVDSIGVLYGYGSRQELVRAGATYLVQTPGEIALLVRQASETG